MTCPEGWTAVENSCMKASSDKVSWYEAEKKCSETKGAHLASCFDAREMLFAKQNVINRWRETWIGVTDM